MADPTDKDKPGADPDVSRAVDTNSDRMNADAGDMPAMEIPREAAEADDGKESPDEEARPTPRRRSRAPWVVLVLVLIAAAAGGAYWLALQQSGMNNGVVAELNARHRALQSALTRLEGEIAPLRALGGRTEALETRVAALDESLKAASGSVAGSAASAEQLAALERKIETARADVETAVKSALEQVNGRIAALEAARGQLSGSAEDAEKRAAEIAASEAARERRLDALRAENDALKSSLDTLTKRLAAVETAAAQPRAPLAGRENAFALAVGQLRAVLANGDPFARDFAAVAALAPDGAETRAALSAIAPHAATGVATRAVLAARFTSVADAVASAGVHSENESWVDTTLARLKRVVTVRRSGVPEAGDDPAAVAARAESLLAQGDIAGAVKEVETLKGDAADAAKAWLADARARVAADAAASTLARQAVAALSGDVSGGAKAPGGNVRGN